MRISGRTRARSTTRGLGVVGLVVALALGLLAPSSAAAPPSRDVAATAVPGAGGYPPAPLHEFGSRVLADGGPLAGATVVVYDAVTRTQVASTTTTAYGEWSFPLPPGDYRVGVFPPQPYAEQYAVGRTVLCAADVLTNPGVVPDVEVTTEPPRQPETEVSGEVVLDGVTGVVDVELVVSSVSGGTPRPVASMVFPMTPSTSWTAAYDLPLPPGEYRVSASAPGYGTVFADGRTSLDDADTFCADVGRPAQVPTIVLVPQVVEPAAVEGQVLGWMDPLDGATVTVYDAITGAVLGQQVLGEGEYEYHIGGLPPGQVKVGATRPGWVADFANDRDTLEQADVFTLVAGEPLSQSWDPMVLYLDLTPGALVEGTVVANGAPVEGATVDLLTTDGTSVVATVLSDATGAFRLDGLAAGDVRVRATKAGLTTAFGSGDGQTVQGVYTLIPTEADGPVLLDLSTTDAAALQGTVRGVNQTAGVDGPLQGVRVTAYDASTGASLASVQTDATGAYLFGDLAATQVKIRAAKTGFITTFAYGRRTLATADVIPLTSGQTVTAAELTLDAAAAIEGEVLGNFDPLGGATVSVLDAATGRVIRSVKLGEFETTYRIDNLPPGDVKVRASKPGWLTAYADGARTFADARVFALVSGQTLTQSWDPVALYLDLGAAAAVHGQVLGDGAPLEGVRVTVVDATTGVVLRSALSDASGRYLVQGIPITTGGDLMPVRVRFAKAGWVTTFAPGEDPAAPGIYHLFYFDDVGLPTTDLAREGVLTGAVLGIDDSPDSPWDDPLPGVRVTAFDASTGAAVRSVTTDALGRFRIGGLPAGAYQLRARLDGWVTTFASGKPSLDTADVFCVAAGQTVALDEPMVLYAQAVISGDIMGFSGPPNDWDDPLGGVRVVAVDDATGRVVASDVTGTTADPDFGEFRLAVPPGSYVLRATLDGWTTTWDHDRATRAEADVHTVGAGEELGLTSSWAMLRQTTLEGQVLGQMDPLGGATVTVFDAATGRALRSVVADGDGMYRVTVPTPYGGSAVKVRATKSGWYPSWADGRTTMATADVFGMPEGGTLSQQWDPLVLYLDLRPRS